VIPNESSSFSFTFLLFRNTLKMHHLEATTDACNQGGEHTRSQVR
jgi:hypothetical protein